MPDVSIEARDDWLRERKGAKPEIVPLKGEKSAPSVVFISEKPMDLLAKDTSRFTSLSRLA